MYIKIHKAGALCRHKVIMYSFFATLTFLVLITTFSSAATFEEQYDALPFKKKELYLEYTSIPLIDFVCIPYSKKQTIAYQLALSRRQDFQDIDWQVESPVEMARQLWKFQLKERNSAYGASLLAVCRDLMRLHNIDE